MSFVRPEIAGMLNRWREALWGAAIAAAGLWWALSTGSAVAWIGWLVTAIGGGMIGAGLQRGRFRSGTGGPGVVRVDEGQIAYFGPITGGIAALTEVESVKLDRSRDPAVWCIAQPGRPVLEVPVNAEGAEALFDAFGALQGFDTRAMLAALHASDKRTITVWKSPVLRLH